MATGLMQDASMPQPPANTPQPPALTPFAMGIVPMESLSSIQLREQAREAATEANNKPVIQGLAAHVRTCWSAAWSARRTSGVEERMLKSVRQRRGEYDPEILTEIRKGSGSELYMMLTSNKCRSAAGWLRDVLLGTKGEKPWTINPTPIPDLPPIIMQSIQGLAQQEAQTFMQATGMPPNPQQQQQLLTYVKDRIIANAKKKAEEFCDLMEDKMEDQLIEGDYQKALTDFIDDLVTFPTAFMVGPIVRNKKQLTWVPSQVGYRAEVKEVLTLEWERADPFMMYPAPHSTNIDDGYLIRRHRLTRSQLNEMKGMDGSGYNDDAINTVLDEHGKGGLHDWLVIDSQKAIAEGKSANMIMSNPEATIDALQFWGNIQGKMLVEWGMPEDQVPDEMKEYPCEVWLIGQWVIKAQINSDPLGRKIVYKASYEDIPGVFWGNSVADLCRDTQQQCNNAARAIANNMGIGSGPQVVYNVDRLPAGEDLTQMYPWKIWQATSDPYGSQQAPVTFFAPPMISGELMNIYKFFSDIADEHTGIPRYMAGDASGAGALRTSSGMSMLMNNAGKGIKQVVSNIDRSITEPLIERLWFYNMMYGDDDSLKGDIHIVARGANSLVIKETQQQRINEFLQLALTNPLVNQIVGEEAIASLLRVGAKGLDMDTDSLIPPPEVIRARVMQAQQAQAAQAKEAQAFQMQLALAPSSKQITTQAPEGTTIVNEIDVPHVGMAPQASLAPPQVAGNQQHGPSTMSNPNQSTGGRPITDTFSPMKRA
jgi:hypothetical protein